MPWHLTEIPPGDRTGWSGDGSPTDTGSYNVLGFPRELRGILRDFFGRCSEPALSADYGAEKWRQLASSV